MSETLPPKFTRFPVITLGAEYLVMGYLMRRNILAYKAPPNNEGYDLICIHPDPRKITKQIRVQVKSRLATDHGGGFPVRGRSIDAFDYLIVAFLNVGYFLRKRRNHLCHEGFKEPDFYTFPSSFIRTHHNAKSSWEKVTIRGLNLASYHNQTGFELIAKDLGIDYPTKNNKIDTNVV